MISQVKRNLKQLAELVVHCTPKINIPIQSKELIFTKNPCGTYMILNNQ